jgi:hypothetical protein
MAVSFNTGSFFDYGVYNISGDSSSPLNSYSTIYANAKYTFNPNEGKYVPTTNGTAAITDNLGVFMEKNYIGF